MLEAPGLMALSRLKPGSSLLFDCCKRVLTAEYDEQLRSPFDAARSAVLDLQTGRSKVFGDALLRRFVAGRGDRRGQRQSVRARRRAGRIGIPLAGSRSS